MKYIEQTLLVIALLAFLLVSCKKEESPIVGQIEENFEYSISPIDLQGINAQFVENIAYDNKTRTQFDIFLPNSSQPTGLVIYVHGGGFVSGDKNLAYVESSGEPDNIRAYLNNNIAFASISYTLLEDTGETEGVLKPMHDVKRALQYIRSRHEDFNIIKEEVVLSGGSAGAGTCLWIAFNDDMKDINNADPVLWESTRVLGVAAKEPQCSYDIQRWIDDVFIDYGVTFSQITANPGFEENFNRLYGISDINDFDSPSTIAYRDSVDMLDLLTADDPELWAKNTSQDVVIPTTSGIMNHHAYHGRELKERADAVGVDHVIYYGLPLIYADPSSEDRATFCIRKLTE